MSTPCHINLRDYNTAINFCYAHSLAWMASKHALNHSRFVSAPF